VPVNMSCYFWSKFSGQELGIIYSRKGIPLSEIARFWQFWRGGTRG
jgi:hypothetical protein